MSRTFLPLAIGLICLVGAFVGVGFLWSNAGLHMTMHGWIAYGLGCAVSVALSAGLFFLTFKSAREGYDDAQNDLQNDE
ncbi:MAG: hypothetical protein GYB42_02290 [Alphaproteobacteria bacterium]|nr:hypothetical protein [Alphaproteobacteria bacterium]